MVGVGDGPWDTMHTLYKGTEARCFDNFTFVNYTELQQQAAGLAQDAFATRFAEEVLHKVPSQLEVHAVAVVSVLPEKRHLPVEHRRLCWWY